MARSFSKFLNAHLSQQTDTYRDTVEDFETQPIPGERGAACRYHVYAAVRRETRDGAVSIGAHVLRAVLDADAAPGGPRLEQRWEVDLCGEAPATCPPLLLARLSPPRTPHDAAWRGRCILWHREVAATSPQPGDVITIRPVLHGGVVIQEALLVLARTPRTGIGMSCVSGEKIRFSLTPGKPEICLRLPHGAGRWDYVSSQYDWLDPSRLGVHDRPADPAHWQCREVVVRRANRRPLPLAFAYRLPEVSWGLTMPLAVLAMGSPEAVQRLVATHNAQRREVEDIAAADCWI